MALTEEQSRKIDAEIQDLRRRGFTDSQIVAEMERRYGGKTPVAGSTPLSKIAPIVGGAKLLDKGLDILAPSQAAGGASLSAIAPAAVEAPTAVGSAMTASGAPGILMSDGSVVAAAGEGAAGYGGNQGLSAIGPQGPLGDVAGAAAALKGGYDIAKGFEKGGEGYRTSFTTAGAGISTLAGVGPLPGAAIGNVVGYLADRLGLHRQSTKQREQARWDDIIDAEYTGAADFFSQTKGGEDTQRQAYENAPEGFVGFTDDGIWVNKEFGTSRDEGTLRPRDIWGTPDFFNAFGNDWLGKFSEEERWKISKAILDAGLIREKKGGVYFTDDAAAKQVGLDVLAGKIDVPGYAPYAQPGAVSAPPASSVGAPGGYSVNINYSGATPAEPTGAERAGLALSMLQSNPYAGGNQMPNYGKLGRNRYARNRLRAS